MKLEETRVDACPFHSRRRLRRHYYYRVLHHHHHQRCYLRHLPLLSRMHNTPATDSSGRFIATLCLFIHRYTAKQPLWCKSGLSVLYLPLLFRGNVCFPRTSVIFTEEKKYIAILRQISSAWTNRVRLPLKLRDLVRL